MSQTSVVPDKGARLLRAVALLLIAAGLAVGAGTGWHWLGRVRHVAHQQEVLDRTLDERWGTAAGPARTGAADLPVRPARRVQSAGPDPGTPIARLHLPTLGERHVVVEGAGDPQLMKGPGRMVETAPLGGPGNTAVAAHRYPGVFWNLDRLTAGDPVVVETAGRWLVYRTVRTVVVQPDNRTVLAAPDPAAPPVLTLITCEPRLSTAQRLVKQAVLVRTEPRGAGLPPELSRPAR